MALLDLMHNSLFGDDLQQKKEGEPVVKISQRKMFFKVHVLYVDEGQAVYGWDEATHKKHLNMVEELCQKRYQFTFTIIPLEAIFDTRSSDLEMRVPSPE